MAVAGSLADIKPILSPGPNSPKDKKRPSIIKRVHLQKRTYNDGGADSFREAIVESGHDESDDAL